MVLAVLPASGQAGSPGQAHSLGVSVSESLLPGSSDFPSVTHKALRGRECLVLPPNPSSCVCVHTCDWSCPQSKRLHVCVCANVPGPAVCPALGQPLASLRLAGTGAAPKAA